MQRKPETEEEIYFKKQEMAQRAKLREKMEADARRLKLEQRRGELADVIKALGFDGEKAKLFNLMPLVHVAWADGAISRKERSMILGVVKARGVQPGSEAFQMMESMLEEPPPPEFMEESLAILKQTLDGAEGTTLVELCVQVAEASGGFLGIGDRVDPKEREAIETIARAFGNDALRAVYRALH
ncbi:MAG: TerB family tellurite resistance protein [Myxococcales bacterium]|nr:TerB family tellurite resistance protein [Myxococcales bacterium]